MEALTAYVIPVSSLRSGRNELDFKVDWRFFRHFEDSPIEQGSFDIKVLFDKHLDHWHLHFGLAGEMDTDCDRCLAPISLPVSGSYELFVRFDEDGREGETGEDVVYVPRETALFDIAQYIYEFIVLSVPVSKTIDCENKSTPPCDMEMLARLQQQDQDLQKDEETPWDILKKMNIGRG